MRRKILFGAVALLGLILILVVAVFWYIRSGRLDLYLQGQIIAALKDVGIDAEIGQAHLDLAGYKVKLSDVKLSSAKTHKPIGSVSEILTEFSVISYLEQKIEITKVVITHPDFRIEVDPQGRTSIDDLHSPPERPDKKETIKFISAYLEVLGGKLVFVDNSRNIEAKLPDFYAKFNSSDQQRDDPANHPFEFGLSQPGTVTLNGRTVDTITARITAELGDSSAKLKEAWVKSDLATVNILGDITSFKPLKYDLKVDSSLVLDQIARVFAPSTKLGGTAKFSGTVEGTGVDYKIAGGLSSNALSAEGFNVAGLQVKSSLTGSGAEYTATGDVTTGRIGGRGIEISSVRLGPARLTGRGADFDITSTLALPTIKSGKVTVSALRGKLTADPDHLSFSDITASVVGGTLSGSASIALSGGSSKVEVSFKALDLNQATTLASAKEVILHGTVNGTAKLAFPGFNYKAATGRVDATFDATVAPPASDADTSPATGEISLLANGGGFNIEKAVVHSARSDVTATGAIGWDSVTALDINFKSADMAEVQRVLDSFGLIPEDVKDWHKITLSGEGSFTGRVQGKLSAPNVSGHLALADIKADEQPVGSFQGDIAYEPSMARVDNATVISPGGGRADFKLSAALQTKDKGKDNDNISVSGTVLNFDLPTLIRAAVPEFKNFVVGGVITGKFDLKGLPGPRTVDGSAEVTLTAAEFNPSSDEDEKAAKKISVPEFKGQVSFANSVLSVKDLTMRIGDSQMSGLATINLDTYAYTINAEGKNLDLAELSERANSVKMSGRADFTVTGQGMWKEWATTNLSGTLQGKNVTIEGRDLGDAKLVAVTDNGVLRVEATANVLDQARTFTATIDLRERKTLPVNASIEFTDSDIGPYLALISPGLSSLTGRATGTIKLTGTLLDADQSFNTEGLHAVATITKLEVGGAISDRQRYTITNEGPVVITGSGNAISIDPVTFTGEGTSVKIAGMISRSDPSKSNLTVNGEVNLRFVSSFIDVVFMTGIAQVQASIAGSLESPRLLGFVNLKDVGIRVVNLPLSMTHGNGQMRFTADQALIENFTASTPGGGTMLISGGAALSGLVPDRWRLEAQADQVAVEYPRDTQSIFDAHIVFQGSRRIQGVLSGEIDVRRASYTKEVTMDELITTGGPFGPEFVDIGPGGGGGGGFPISADLRITADNTLIVRNNLADALGSAYLNIRGPLSDPTVSGRVTLTQGTLQFRNDRYELTRCLITFPPKRRSEPVFDVQAEADISGYRVSVSFTDTPSKLKTTLRSDPELAEKDIVALILTGSVTNGRSDAAVVTQSGIGLAQSILAASLSEKLEKGTRFFGLSKFSVDPLVVGRGNDPTARVTVGRRITKDLTITYSQNLTSGGGSGLDRVALVEYRLSNRFSLVGIRNERGELGFDVRIRKRF